MYDSEYEAIWDISKNIPGYLSKIEGYFLFQAVKNNPLSGDVLEIGPFCGRSTTIMGTAIKNFSPTRRIYTIDNFVKQKSNLFPKITNPKMHLIQVLKETKLDTYTTLIEGNSTEEIAKLDKEFSLVFFDGKHTEKQITSELYLIEPKIKKGGKLIFHDYGNIHVETKYTEYLKNKYIDSNSCIYIHESTPNHKGNGMLFVEVNHE